MGTATTTPLPSDLHAARVREGVAVLETEAGSVVGRVELQPGGWYFTPTGYERLFTTLAEWQLRLDAMEHQVSAIRAAPLPRPSPPPAPSPIDAAAIFLAFVLGLVLGWAGRTLFTRRPSRSP